MIKIGILTVEDTPDNKPTLDFFSKVEKRYNAKTIVLEAKYISYLYSKEDATDDVSKNQSEKKYIHYKNKLIKLDALLPKIDSGASAEEFLLAVNIMDYVRNHTDITVINYTKGMLISNDKFWQGEYIASHGYTIPKTAFITSQETIDTAMDHFEKYPLIVKNQYGAGGSGVAIVESERSAKSVISTMLSKNNNVVVQEYLPVLGGTDYRVYVIGGKAVKGIIRTAPAKEFRANVALGGKKKSFNPDKQLSALAVEIANLVGLEIAAVDFMYYRDKYYFIEINKNPGTKNDPKTAEKMLSYVVDRCKKKVQKLVIPRKRYLIKDLDSVKKIFSDLDYNFFGVGVKSFDVLASSFFIEKYGILAYRYTNDLKLMSHYSRVKSMEEEDLDYFNFYSSIKYSDNIEFAKVENYLRKFKDPTLFVYDTTPQIEKIIEHAKANVIFANKEINYKKYQNRFYLSKLLVKHKIRSVEYVHYELGKILSIGYKKLSSDFGKNFNIYLSGKDLKYVKKVFYIANQKDYDSFYKIITDISFPTHEIDDVHVCSMPKGIPLSVNGCITQKGVLVSFPSFSLLDIPQVNNKLLSYRLKNCGSMWGKHLLSPHLLDKLVKIVKKTGNLMHKNNHYIGLFNLDIRFDHINEEFVIVSCNPRPSGSLAIEDLARAFKGQIPLQAFQILESLEINYNFDYEKFAKMYEKPIFLGTNLYLFNRTNKEIMIDKGIKPGIYELTSKGNIKYIEESLDFNLLNENQFIIVESIASVDRTLVLEDDRSQILGLIFPKPVYEIGKGLSKNASKIVEIIYKKLGI